MAHLKRYQMPASWGLKTKGETFVIRPKGSYPLLQSIPLRVALRDLLGLGQTRKEVNSILTKGMALVDKKPRKSGSFPLGLMDILEIPGAGTFSVQVSPAGLLLKEAKAADKKLCKIIGKTTIKKGMDQLHLHDGRNILAGKKSPYRPGDSIQISLPGQEILSHLPLKEGGEALIVKGRNRGLRGKIISLPQRKFMMEKATAVLESAGGGKSTETLRDYLFVITAKKGEKA